MTAAMNTCIKTSLKEVETQQRQKYMCFGYWKDEKWKPEKCRTKWNQKGRIYIRIAGNSWYFLFVSNSHCNNSCCWWCVSKFKLHSCNPQHFYVFTLIYLEITSSMLTIQLFFFKVTTYSITFLFFYKLPAGFVYKSKVTSFHNCKCVLRNVYST